MHPGEDSNPRLDTPPLKTISWTPNSDNEENSMNQIVAYLAKQFSRTLTAPLLGVGVFLMLIALFIGISDNPPGVGLAYLGVAFICLSMIHHWRSARDFWTLLAVAVISFPVMVLIHNMFDTINAKIGMIPVLNQLLGGIAIISFVGGVLVAPAVTLVALLGGIVYLIKK